MGDFKEKYQECPRCKTRSLLIVDIDSELPKLSPSGTYMYYCPYHKEPFWAGQSSEQGPDTNTARQDNTPR